jgi:protein-L-isoaspartate O-methyltransferase
MAKRIGSCEAGQVDQAFNAVDVTEFLFGTLSETVSTASDEAILTAKDPSGMVTSAISNRDFLRLIARSVQPLHGLRVFEIGSGTGYFSAVLAELCGPEGQVQGCEILPDLYQASQANVSLRAKPNIELHFGDFIDVLPRSGTFDVIIGTSSVSIIHASILAAAFEHGGLIALPIEIPGGGDCFTVFRRHGQVLRVIAATLSMSVPTTGAYTRLPPWASPVDSVLPNWRGAQKTLLHLDDDKVHPIYGTAGFRSYLHYTEPQFVAVNVGRGELRSGQMAFGLTSADRRSACLQLGHRLVVHGVAGIHLAAKFQSTRREWHTQGCPRLDHYRYSLPIVPGGDIVLTSPIQALHRLES